MTSEQLQVNHLQDANGRRVLKITLKQIIAFLAGSLVFITSITLMILNPQGMLLIIKQNTFTSAFMHNYGWCGLVLFFLSLIFFIRAFNRQQDRVLDIGIYASVGLAMLVLVLFNILTTMGNMLYGVYVIYDLLAIFGVIGILALVNNYDTW